MTRLTLQNVFVNLAYYAATLLVLPAAALRVDTGWGLSSHTSWPALRIASGLLGALGALLQAWCIVLFQRLGRGTPSPAIPTRHLVTTGPYRWVRNPINLGEMMVFLALAGWFASPALLGYTLLAGTGFHLFIVIWEEPRHALEFGDEFERYKARVNRWLPGRLRSSGSGGHEAGP